MQIKQVIIFAAAIMLLSGCVSQPTTIEEVQRQQERRIDNLQSHRYDAEQENNDGIDG